MGDRPAGDDPMTQARVTAALDAARRTTVARPNLVEARSRVTRELEWLVAELAEAVSDPDAQDDLAGWERWMDELEGALTELRALRRASVEEDAHGTG